MSSEGVLVRKFVRILDDRGDLVTEIALKGTNARGTKYVIRDGSTVVVKMDGNTIGSVTMGTASTSGGH